MKNLLILTSGYCGKATANGLCAQALVKAMEKEGLGAYIVSCDTEQVSVDPGGKVVSLWCPRLDTVQPKRSFLQRVWNRMKLTVLYTWTPKYQKQMVEKLVKAASDICKETDISGIVCMFFPLETIIAGWHLKKRFPQIPMIVYELDSVTDGIGGSVKRNGSLLFSYRRFMGALYKKADSVMVLKCHEKCWLKEHDGHKTKMRIVDLPLVFPAELPQAQEKTPEPQMLYAGELSLQYRSPQCLLKACESLEESFSLHFYSKGCETQLQEAAEKDGRIHCHGYVDRSTLNAAVARADIMLSIGNQVSNSLPSKIITYMTYGKPIIHFSLQPNDICAEYLKQYPLALVLEWNTDIQSAAGRIAAFMKESAGKTVPFGTLEEMFPMNVPAYSLLEIRKVIGWGCDNEQP